MTNDDVHIEFFESMLISHRQLFVHIFTWENRFAFHRELFLFALQLAAIEKKSCEEKQTFAKHLN